MAELFIELLSEEIPAQLQIDARHKIKYMLDERLSKVFNNNLCRTYVGKLKILGLLP